ncbi:hypothetical protein SDJN03_25061, partial [Cucurbita argyrosperma subsp. sororia]
MNIESFKPSSRAAKPSQDEPRLGAGHVQGTCGAKGAWVVTHVEAQTSGQRAVEEWLGRLIVGRTLLGWVEARCEWVHGPYPSLSVQPMDHIFSTRLLMILLWVVYDLSPTTPSSFNNAIYGDNDTTICYIHYHVEAFLKSKKLRHRQEIRR